MGYAKCEISGHIADISDGLTKNGKKYVKIKLATGKSEKRDDGTWDNSNQAWWELTAWGDYAGKIMFEGLKKGDKIRASIQDPVPHTYATQDGRIGCTINATIWNHTLTKVIWFPKGASSADDHVPQDDDSNIPPDAMDFDPAAYEAMMGQ